MEDVSMKIFGLWVFLAEFFLSECRPKGIRCRFSVFVRVCCVQVLI